MDINLIPILVCGVASMVIGFLWYSPFLFGNVWMKLSGISKETIKEANSKMPIIYGTMFVASLVMAYVLSMVVSLMGVTEVMDGVKAAVWVWLGFIATTMLTGVLYEGKPLKLYAINSGYHLVTLLVMGIILVMIG